MISEKDHIIVPPVIHTEFVATSDEDGSHTDTDRRNSHVSKPLSSVEDRESTGPSMISSSELSKRRRRTMVSPPIDTGKHNGMKKLYPFLFPDFEYVYRLFQSNSSLKERTNEISVSGFELYLVETWALQREKTCILPAYTGNMNSVISCCQMFLPLEPKLWPDSNLRSYYRIMSKIGFLKYISGKGYIFVADIHNLNLNHFQITNLILIPNGTTIRDVWNNFVLNLNLRELQCSGRTNSMFQLPSSSTIEKFTQLYKIPKKSLGTQLYDYYVDNDYDSNSPSLSNYNNRQINKHFMKLCTDVELLVYMIQTSLWFFDLFDKEDIDGLLCKNTQRALFKWQKSFGAVYFPHLNQTMKTSITYNRINSNLITALISLVTVIFFKLKKLDCFENLNIECNKKDPFMNPSLLFYGISAFQFKLDAALENPKASKGSANHSKYLNFHVIDKLFELTDETESADMNQFRKILKSTMDDFTISKKGIKKALSKMGSNNFVDSLASATELTNSIDDFVDKIQVHKEHFKNSETFLATTSTNSSGLKGHDFDPEVFMETINANQMELENTYFKDDSILQRTKDNKKPQFESDFYKSIRFQFPKNIISIIGYMWIEISFPITSYFGKSKNKEYDYGFYNRFVWFDYNANFDNQYREMYQTEATRLMDDIEVLKDSGSRDAGKQKGKPDDNLYLRQKMKKSLTETSKLKTSEIIERFRIHQFYSSFGNDCDNTLDEITKELYDYYNYKFVEHNEITNNILMSPKENTFTGQSADINNTVLSLHQNSSLLGIDDSTQKSTEGQGFMQHLPVDDKLIDTRSREHIKIYEKVQEEIVKTNLDAFLRKEIYNPSFENELVRRNSIANFNFLREKVNSKPVFIRSQSFSLVEDSVNEFRNDLISSRSIAQHIRTGLEEFDTAEARIRSMNKYVVLEKIKKMNQETVAEFNKDFELTKTSLFQRLQTNSTQIEKQKKQLDSTVSRYSYDTRLLERKIASCTDTQEAYEAKLDKMKAKLLQDAKSKGLQYLVQLHQDKIVTAEEIKEIYNSNNNYLINKELGNILNKLGDSSEPRDIINVMRRSRLQIYCRGTNRSIIISNILRLIFRLYHMIMMKINSIGKKGGGEILST